MTRESGTGPLERLPGPVRARVVALTAQVLPDVPELPGALRRVADFAPARRVRSAGPALAGSLAEDQGLRGRVSTLVDARLPADAPDTDVAAALWLRDDADGLAEVLGRLARPASTGRSEAELDRLRERTERLEGEARRRRAEHRAELAGLKQENADLRRKLGTARGQLRESRAELAELAERWRGGEQERERAAGERDAEVRRLRGRVDQLQAALERARGEARGQREDGTLRARLLLDTLLEAGSGLRRELGLPPVTGSPAARTEEALSAGHRADEGGPPEGPAMLEQLLALPRARMLVDGYNVTRSVWESSSLEAQRARLLRGLGPLVARTGAETTVVFDAAHADVRPVVAGVPRGVRVVFSPPGRLADDVIADLVAAEPPGRVVVVVSSDREVADGTRRAGFRAVGAPSLLGLLG